MIGIYQLKVFSTVAKLGNISRAAEQLYLTQSAVSQHIKNLESQLGVELFIRARRGVSLTPAGETLLQYSEKILWLNSAAESAVMDVGKIEEGILRIAATSSAAGYLLPTWIRLFHESFPALKVSSVTDTTNKIIELIKAEQADLGFVEGDLEDLDFISHMMLRDSELHIVVGPHHEWWGKKNISIKDLDQQMFISHSSNNQARQWEDKLFSEYDVTPKIIAEFDEPETIKRAVMEGGEAAILPCCVVRDERDLGKIHLISLDEKVLKRSVNMVWNRKLPLSSVAQAFIDTLRVQFPQLDNWVSKYKEEELGI